LRSLQYARRFESSQAGSSTSPAASGGGSGAITGGLVGGGVALGIGYGLYHFSGARSTVNTISSTKKQFENALKKTTEAAPEPDQAIQWLRKSASGYTGLIPGAQQYVDGAFDELESIKKEHGQEADKIVKDAYNDLRKISGDGVSMEALTKAWEVLQTAGKRIKDLAGDVGTDLLEKNPQLKEQFGGKFQELKRMGDQYGPEAKKQVDETWNQVQDVVKGGVGVGTFDQIRKLIEEKIQKVQQLGDQAWDKGIEQAKPYLDKSPKVKEFVEKNRDKLKNANLSELWQKVKDAAQSGDTSDLESFAKQKAKDAQQSFGGGQGMEQYLKMIPGGEDVSGKLRQLWELSEKHGDKAEKLIKEAFEEVKGVLEKKVDEGKNLADEASKDAK
jgi:hypothetical protein